MSITLTLAVAAALAAPGALPPGSGAPSQIVNFLDGQVVDLSADVDGSLLYCTTAGDVGRLDAEGAATLLVDGSSGAFPFELRAVHPTPDGAVAVVDVVGDLYHVPALGGAPTLVYQDLYLINEPTDLVVDASGNHAVAVQTISTGYRAIAWIDVSGPGSPSDKLWSYYLVKHRPVALAHDPQTGGFLLADAAAAGSLLALTTGPSPETSPLDTVTGPGFSSAALDGDLATEADGSAWWVAGDDLYRHDRISGVTSLVESGGAPRRAVAIGPSSSASGSVTGYSVWLVEGSSPSALREVANAAPPAPVFAASMGTVPGRGLPVLVHVGLNAYCLSGERGGTLLIGGDQWDQLPQVRRFDPATGGVAIVANQDDGITFRIEGLTTLPDGAILGLTSEGRVHRIDEHPTVVSTVFDDPGDQLVMAKGFTRDRDGRLFIAERAAFGWGRVWEADGPGPPSVLAFTDDTRGALADVFTGDILVSEWVSAGFGGRVASVDVPGAQLETFGAFDTLNFANGSIWGDGELLLDCRGAVYTTCEDGFAVHRYDRYSGERVRVGAGYLNRPSGLAIAPSRPTTTSDTGWSLYVSEWTNLWELPGSPAPAPRALDRAAPPIGAPVGFVPPQYGDPRFAVADPDGGAALIGTDGGHLLRLPLDGSAATVLAGPADGLGGDLVAGAVDALGTLWVATADGVVSTLSAGTGWSASTFFTDPQDLLENVRALALRANGDLFVLDRPASTPAAGRVSVVAGDQVADIARTARGEGAAVCPLSGELFVSQRGAPGDGRGEVLRVAVTIDSVRAGHVLPSDLTTPRGYDVGQHAGPVAFDADGHLYLGAGDEGRVHRLDRVTGDTTVLAGGYDGPTGLFLAPGTPGVAGPQGTSLFVLDGHALYEHGVAGLPAPTQAAPSGGGGPIDLAAAGRVDFGATTPMSIDHPGAAGAFYFVLPGTSGKDTGFPLAALGKASDPRILPLDLDPLWFQYLLPPTFVNFQGTLDGSGQSPPTLGILVPADPALESAGVFVDLFWIAVDFFAPNGVSTIGGTTHLFLGP